MKSSVVLKVIIHNIYCGMYIKSGLFLITLYSCKNINHCFSLTFLEINLQRKLHNFDSWVVSACLHISMANQDRRCLSLCMMSFLIHVQYINPTSFTCDLKKFKIINQLQPKYITMIITRGTVKNGPHKDIKVQNMN